MPALNIQFTDKEIARLRARAKREGLACNHAFINGNKRTAWLAAATFLGVNGHPVDDPLADEDAAEELVLAVATSAMRDIPSIASELVKFFR